MERISVAHPNTGPAVGPTTKRTLAHALRFLERPFEEGVKWRLNERSDKVRSQGRGLFVPYVPIEFVLKRLNEAVKEGVLEDWTASYEPLPALTEGRDTESETPNRGRGRETSPIYVLCTLRIKVGETWHERSDVGEGGDYKEAFSDALKRVARQYGVGAYVGYMRPRETATNGFAPTEWKPLREEELQAIKAYFGKNPDQIADSPNASSSSTTPSSSPEESGTAGEEGGGGAIVKRLEKAHEVIAQILGELKAMGAGAEALKVLLEHKWAQGNVPQNPSPEDLKKASEVYRSLQALKAKVEKEKKVRQKGAG